MKRGEEELTDRTSHEQPGSFANPGDSMGVIEGL